VAAHADTGGATGRGISPRAIVLGLVGVVLALAWVEYSELVTPTSQMSESTPPIPAIMLVATIAGISLLALRLSVRASQSARAAGKVAARLLSGLSLGRSELVAVYLFLIVACALPSVGIVRLILPCLMGVQYFGQSSNHYDEMSRFIPRQWAPVEGEAVRTFWEGAATDPPPSAMGLVPIVGPALEGAHRFFAQSRAVPWGEWGVPFGVWSLYFAVYFLTSFCLVTVFRRKWSEEDRLQFPIASMTVEFLRSGRSPGTAVPFLRDPVMWTGFGLAVLYNALNMLKEFRPDVPAMGLQFPVGQYFTEYPWNAMQGLAVWYKPEVLGFGYLVPSDIQLSILVFSLFHWVARPLGAARGVQVAGYPFSESQATGAMVVLGLYFIWQGRRRLAEAVRKALTGDRALDDTREPIPYRLAVIGTALGLAFLVGFPIAYGVKAWQAGAYFAIGTLFLLVYCRNRAETGLPIVWGYPLLMQKRVLTNFLGSDPFIRPGHLRSYTLLNVFGFLQRGTYYAVTSTMQESCIVGEALGLGARRTAKLVSAAVVIGFVATLWMYLSAYYTWGGNVMETAGGQEGGQRVQIAMDEFAAASRWLDQPVGPDVPARNATLLGCAITLLLIGVRRVAVWFPLHPVGYALASCHDNYMWFPALVNCVVKASVIRIGGQRLYRRLVPGFVAFTLGHFFSVGVWSFIGLYASDWVQLYRVWFL